MTFKQHLFAWITLFVFMAATLWLLGDILFPFVAGIALAYFLDPIADMIQQWKVPRWAAAALLTLAAVFTVFGLLLVIIPLLQTQLTELSLRAPGYIDVLRTKALEMMVIIQSQLTDADIVAIKEKVGGAASADLIVWFGGILSKIWGGGAAILNLLSLLIITPIVMFYLLRDWDKIVQTVEGWLPRRHAQTVRDQVLEINFVLSGFLRGQVLVCGLLGSFYAICLTVIGLDFGFVIGLGTGVISFVPYFGMLVGFVVGVGVAIAQFGEWQPIILVVAVFVIGQFLEGNFFTPKLVGDKIGLHPVWIIFLLLAGGTLFGFTGILLAVPVGAVVGVLGRFLIAEYKTSKAYLAEIKDQEPE